MPVPTLIVARATPKVAGVPQADGGFGWRGVSSPARLELPASDLFATTAEPVRVQTVATRGEPHGQWQGRPDMRASDMRASDMRASDMRASDQASRCRVSGGQPRRFPFAEKNR
jgi:hypothetical protein